MYERGRSTMPLTVEGPAVRGDLGAGSARCRPGRSRVLGVTNGVMPAMPSSAAAGRAGAADAGVGAATTAARAAVDVEPPRERPADAPGGRGHGADGGRAEEELASTDGGWGPRCAPGCRTRGCRGAGAPAWRRRRACRRGPARRPWTTRGSSRGGGHADQAEEGDAGDADPQPLDREDADHDGEHSEQDDGAER